MDKPLSELATDVKKAAILAARRGAATVMNNLAEAGPNWSGKFSQSWYAEAPNGQAPVRYGQFEGRDYNLWNVPRFNAETVVDPQILIGNFSTHAQEAMDLIPGTFIYPGYEPEGEAEVGIRLSDIRGDLGNRSGTRANNRRTAPLDWYTTYMEGGDFDRDFQHGASIGFADAGRPGGAKEDSLQ